MLNFNKDARLKILECAVEQTSISIIIVDKDGYISYVNNSFTKNSGYTENEVIGRNPRMFKSGFHGQRFYQDLWKTILSGKTWYGEFYNKHKSGRFYWESAIVSPIFNSKGKISHFLCTKEDITDKKMAEKALSVSETKLRSFFSQNNAKILVVETNPVRIIEANEAAKSYYGYSIEEFSNLNLKDNFVGLIEAVKVESLEYHGDYRNVYVQKHRLKNGESHDVEIFPAKVEVDDKILIYIIVQDITQRKKAIEALKESEAKKLALLKIMPDLIFVVNVEGEFVDVYTDQPDRIGIPPHKVLGKKCEQVFPEKLAMKLKRHIKLAVETREVQSFEYKYKKDLKNYIFEEIRIISAGNEEVLVIMRDYTEEKTAQLFLKKAMEDAKEANRVKSVFLANISHEIRTPINAILGFSDLLATELQEPNQKLNLDSIKSSSKTLLNLINDILDLSKIEAGKMTVSYHDMNLKGVLNELGNLFSIKVNEKGLKYTTRIDPRVPEYVVFDEMRLRQILINLLSNAIKFTDKGSVAIRLSAYNFARKDNENFVDLVFEVEDTGIGIKEENQELVFEAFKQQDDQDARKYGGTGLGLTITKRLIHMLNGVVELKSTVGHGSSFTVTFSSVEISRQFASLPKIKRKSRIGQVIFKPATILIADDNKPNRDILKGIFRGSKMDFMMAENGKHAIKLLKNKKPKLALIDIKMPMVGGLELAKYIKTHENLKDIITIGVSATPLNKRKEPDSFFLDDFISKPVDIGLLLELLKQHLSEEPYEMLEDQKEKGDIEKVVVDQGLLNDFKHVRKKRISPALRKMSNTSSFTDYEEFGEILIEIGGELIINDLTYIGTAIKQAVKTFDLDSLSKLVADYKLFEKKILTFKDE